MNNVALLLLQILASTKDRFTNPRIAGIAPDYLDHVCFSNGLTVFESVDIGVRIGVPAAFPHAAVSNTSGRSFRAGSGAREF